MSFDPSSLASVTPASAAAQILSAAAQTATSSGAQGGASALGPKSINISGFGGRSSGSATQSLTQAEPDRGDTFPSSTVGDGSLGFAVPPWLLPAVIGVVVLAVGITLLKRK